MKIGFSILSHQAPGQLFDHLLSQLSRFSNKHIAIHHDFHQAEFPEEKYKNDECSIVQDYSRTYWSHTNNVKAILDTFRILYSHDCEWYVTLSANCFPIKPAQYIEDYLSSSPFDGFIERNNVLTDHFDFYKYFRKGFKTKYLFKVPFLRKNGDFYHKAIRIPRKPQSVLLNNNFVPYHGSDWFMINRKVMSYILSQEAKIKELVQYLADVNKGPDINVCPPEVVFQSILGNSTNFRLNNNNFRYINWENAKDWHPNTLTIQHWKEIETSDALFARKFDWDTSKELIMKIEEGLLV